MNDCCNIGVNETDEGRGRGGAVPVDIHWFDDFIPKLESVKLQMLKAKEISVGFGN